MKYPALDWMVIEAFEERTDWGQPSKLKDSWLLRSYWEAAESEKQQDIKKLSEQIKQSDEEFRKFLIESGVIDNTLKYLWKRYKTPEAVKQQIRKNKLDKLAKYYNLQNQFNEAYTKYKGLPA